MEADRDPEDGDWGAPHRAGSDRGDGGSTDPGRATGTGSSAGPDGAAGTGSPAGSEPAPWSLGGPLGGPGRDDRTHASHLRQPHHEPFLDGHPGTDGGDDPDGRATWSTTTGAGHQPGGHPPLAAPTHPGGTYPPDHQSAWAQSDWSQGGTAQGAWSQGAQPQQPGHPGSPDGSAPYAQAPYPQTQYAQTPYAQAPYAQTPGAPVPGGPSNWGTPSAPLRSDYAHWGRRVGASLIDGIPGLVAATVLLIGYVRFFVSFFEASVQGGVPALPSGLAPWVTAVVILYLVSLGWSVYDRWLLQGRTGQTLGKRVLKIRLINEANGAPIGAGMAFVRDLVHYLDGAAYVGYLWPLWDDKRQTFADKLLKTVVVDVTENQPLTIAKDRSEPEPFR